jgi:hypothetical protein
MVDRRGRGRLWAWVHLVLFGDDGEDDANGNGVEGRERPADDPDGREE